MATGHNMDKRSKGRLVWVKYNKRERQVTVTEEGPNVDNQLVYQFRLEVPTLQLILRMRNSINRGSQAHLFLKSSIMKVLEAPLQQCCFQLNPRSLISIHRWAVIFHHHKLKLGISLRIHIELMFMIIGLHQNRSKCGSTSKGLIWIMTMKPSV